MFILPYPETEHMRSTHIDYWLILWHSFDCPIGVVFKKYPKPKSVRKSITTIKLPKHEDICSTKQVLYCIPLFCHFQPFSKPTRNVLANKLSSYDPPMLWPLHTRVNARAKDYFNSVFLYSLSGWKGLVSRIWSWTFISWYLDLNVAITTNWCRLSWRECLLNTAPYSLVYKSM